MQHENLCRIAEYQIAVGIRWRHLELIYGIKYVSSDGLTQRIRVRVCVTWPRWYVGTIVAACAWK